MKIGYYLILVVLVFLAVTSGITKILLMPQDVEFFGAYGFSDITLIIYGIFQFAGGGLLAIPKTRIVGGMLIALTFLISAVLLALSGNILVTLVTLFFMGLIGFIVKVNDRFVGGQGAEEKE